MLNLDTLLEEARGATSLEEARALFLKRLREEGSFKERAPCDADELWKSGWSSLVSEGLVEPHRSPDTAIKKMLGTIFENLEDEGLSSEDLRDLLLRAYSEDLSNYVSGGCVHDGSRYVRQRVRETKKIIERISTYPFLSVARFEGFLMFNSKEPKE